jgi:hypothetical protein
MLGFVIRARAVLSMCYETYMGSVRHDPSTASRFTSWDPPAGTPGALGATSEGPPGRT